MTAVIQIFVYPDAWPTHLSWHPALVSAQFTESDAQPRNLVIIDWFYWIIANGMADACTHPGTQLLPGRSHMKRKLLVLSSAVALCFAAGSASALTITTNVGATDAAAAATLIPAVLAPSSGISVVGGTESYQGTPTTPQSGT